MPDGDRLRIDHEAGVLFCSEFGRRILGEAGAVNIGVVAGLVRGAAMDTVDETERSGEPNISK